MDSTVKEARELALWAHGSIGQTYAGQDYSVHLEEVEALIRLVFDSPLMRVAAWLHDTVEDVPHLVSFELIERRFGNEARTLVAEVSKVSTKADGNRAARAAKDCAHYAKASFKGKSLKLADVTANLRRIHTLEKKFAVLYVREKAQLLPFLADGDATMFNLAQQALEAAAAYVGLNLSEL
jgi:(p)ppGpp synthase/HD superfamily hydrolase